LIPQGLLSRERKRAGAFPKTFKHPFFPGRLAITNLLWYIVLDKVQDDGRPQPQKIPLIFYRTAAGSEPVREWLKGLDEAERQAIGNDLLRAQWRWPVGMPLCRPMGNGLWEVRTDLPTKRTARVLLCLYREHLVALHGFIKKTRATPDEDLATARKRQKELER
jgi:phage-related protein